MTDSASPAASGTTLPPCFVVLNAASGKSGGDSRVDVIQRVFDAAGRQVEFFPVTTPRLLAQTAARAAEQAHAQQGVLVAVGGDGTINAVARAALERDCLFGALPQGTFNYFGRAHGIAQDLELATQSLLRAQEEAVQVGLVNEHAFLVNASLGLYRQVLEDREGFKRQLGRSRWVAAVSGLMTVLRSYGQLDLSIEIGGKTQRLRTPTLFVGNNALQFDRVGMDDAVAALHRGELAAVAVRPTSTGALLGLALRGALGTVGDAEMLKQFSLRRLTVHMRGRRRIKVATDGEIQWLRAPLVFEVSPRPLRLLLPLPEDRMEIA